MKTNWTYERKDWQDLPSRERVNILEESNKWLTMSLENINLENYFNDFEINNSRSARLWLIEMIERQGLEILEKSKSMEFIENGRSVRLASEEINKEINRILTKFKRD